MCIKEEMRYYFVAVKKLVVVQSIKFLKEFLMIIEIERLILCVLLVLYPLTSALLAGIMTILL